MSIFDKLNLDAVFSKHGDPELPFQQLFHAPEGSKIRFGFGIVSDNKDPDKLARVKVTFPGLEDSSESGWCPVVRPFAGSEAGMCVIPEVGDKVVCAFINDNVKIPVVLGIVFHKKQKPPIDPVPGNEKKIFSTPGGAQILLEDFMGLEKLTIASGDGKMKLVLSVLGGISIANDGGKVEIETKELVINGLDNGSLSAKNDLKISAKGEIKVNAKTNVSLKADKDNVIKGKSKIKLEGSMGVTAKMKQIAVENDQVIGLDMHDEMMPSPSGLVLLPMIPNPYVGQLKDKLSDDVMVKGKKAAVKGSKSKASPGHIVIPPGVQFKKPPNNEGEISSGTESSVKINGKEAAVLLAGVKTCSDPNPQETSKVFAVGVPLAAALAMVEEQFKEKHKEAKQNLADSKQSKKSTKKKSDATKAGHGDKKPKNADKNSDKGKCTTKGHPVDVATGKVFTDNIDFEIDGPIPFKWERSWFSSSTYNGQLGYGWHHPYDMEIIEFEDGDETGIQVRLADGRLVEFPFIGIGEEHYLRSDKLTLVSDSEGYVLRDNKHYSYRFALVGTNEDELKLVSIEDAAGNMMKFAYTLEGALTGINDSGGRVILFTLDEKQRVRKISVPHPDDKDERVDVLKYFYDEDGNLVRVEDYYKKTWLYEYQKHLMVKETNRNELSFYFVYSGSGAKARCTHTWGDEGIFDTKFEYFTEEKRTVIENSHGHKTTYYWNDAGLVTKTIDPLGGKTETVYNEFTELIREIDELGQHTVYEYDERGNQTKVLLPDESFISLEYDGDLVVRMVDRMGDSWRWEYDEKGRIIKSIDPLDQEKVFGYEGRYLSEFRDADNQITKIKYNNIGNLIGAITPDGIETTWEYDLLGRCITNKDQKGNITSIQYSIPGLVQQVNKPGGNIRELEYDAEGNITRVKDQLQDVRFEYTGMDCISARIQEDTRIEFLYDAEGELIGVKNEQDSVYSYKLDSNGNVCEERGFDGVRRLYTRDAKGRIKEIKRSGGITSRYIYNPVDKVVEVLHSDQTFERYSYRKDGEISEASNKYITVGFEYDCLGRITKEFQGDHWVARNFNNRDLRVKMESSLGASQEIMRNCMGDVTDVAFNIKTETTYSEWKAKYTRDELGLELSCSLSGGLESKWERDRFGMPIKHIINEKKSSKRTREYSWNVNDRINYIKDSIFGITNYEYDAFGNLSSATYDDGSKILRISDAIGNFFRTKNRKDRKYGNAGELLKAKTSRGTIQYAYDRDGNLIKKIEPDGKIWQYTWNSSGMLATVTRPDQRIVEFTYDPFNRRISKKCETKTTRWVWDGLLILHEWNEFEDIQQSDKAAIAVINSSGNSIHKHKELFAGKQSDGSFTREQFTTWLFEPDTFNPIGKITGKDNYNIICDHIGAPIAMYNERAEQVWTAQMDIYGGLRKLNGEKHACPFRWPGQYEDEETGLYYNRFRYYDAEIGQYISQDPIGLNGGLALYGYVVDPNIFVDILGLDWNYVILNNDKILYSGMAKDNTSLNDVIKRHSNTVGTDGKRYDPKKGDTIKQITPKGTGHETVRGIEQKGIEERQKPLLGRGSDKVRGNKINGIDKVNKKEKYDARTKKADDYLKKNKAKSVTDLAKKSCPKD